MNELLIIGAILLLSTFGKKKKTATIIVDEPVGDFVAGFALDGAALFDGKLMPLKKYGEGDVFVELKKHDNNYYKVVDKDGDTGFVLISKVKINA